MRMILKDRVLKDSEALEATEEEIRATYVGAYESCLGRA